MKLLCRAVATLVVVISEISFGPMSLKATGTHHAKRCEGPAFQGRTRAVRRAAVKTRSSVRAAEEQGQRSEIRLANTEPGPNGVVDTQQSVAPDY